MTASGAQPVPTAAELRELALTGAEHEDAVRQLGRALNTLELGMLGAMWSEHCSYKTSKPLLRQFETTGPRVVLGPGENAGVVDLGDDLLCCFKIESHNHPSAVEPVQGAATGVGGILRDVFAMGARPVALLDAIRFGDLGDARQRQRFARVVEGIGFYGNCIGVPTVGGETYFDPAYAANCLVNAMCVGLAPRSQLVRATAAGPGNPVLLVGAGTGRDGIHGATFASVQLDDSAEERRPAVQVGNPFLEKCLLEACLELCGHPALVGLQDCGAAGLTSSCAEMAHRGGVGIEIDVARVSRREQGMTPYQVMLSESQERMVLVVERGHEEEVSRVCERWQLHSDVIGRVIAEEELRVVDGDAVVASLPLEILVDGFSERHPIATRPARLDALLAENPLAAPPPWSLEEAWLRVLASPNCAEARWVFRQYDHQVGDDTVAGPGGDAAVLRIKGRRDGIALTVDGGHRIGCLDPRRGAQIAVAEALRNLAAVGAEPLALTNCLNFGDPDQPEVMWQLEEAVAGLAEAARAFEIPVVSGNVSLYNDFRGTGIPPTPVVGMVGHLEIGKARPGLGFRRAGDAIFVVGPLRLELAGSEYQRLAHGEVAGRPPELNFDTELAAARAVRQLVREGAVSSAHDCALGGLAATLTESCVMGGLGATIDSPAQTQTPEPPSWRWAVLFGETQGRYLLSLAPERAPELAAVCDLWGVEHRRLGVVGGNEIVISGMAALPLGEATAAYRGALSQLMQRQ
jgi:phosphoribosylformylglycinamidine synthase